MRMCANWIRMRSFDIKPSGLALPQGYEKKMTDEDAFFEVLDIGPEVTKCSCGDIIAASPMGGIMKFKVPEEDFTCYAVRDDEIIGIISPPNGGKYATTRD